MINFFLFSFCLISFSNARDILLSMPPVKPTKDDQYLCHAMYIGNETMFITGFQPKADASHAHHILIQSCTEPGSTKQSWICDEMKEKDAAPVCKSGLKLIYAWAMNASGLQFPKDVSIMVGKDSGSPYLVIQSHYKSAAYFKRPDSKPDRSGIILNVQSTPTSKLAGIYLLSTDGRIPAKSTVYMEAACSYNGDKPLHPFAFRTHTHKLGKLVSGYVIRLGQWKEIGKKSPQLEQMFYPVTNNLTILKNDILAARCIMENKGNEEVKIGSTRDDEMCNFYIYYWVKREDQKQLFDEDNQMCVSQGWPSFKWEKFLKNLKIPDSAAMISEGTEKINEIVRGFENEEKQMNRIMSDVFDTDSDDESSDYSSVGDRSDFNFKNFEDEDNFF